MLHMWAYQNLFADLKIIFHKHNKTTTLHKDTDPIIQHL